MSRHRLLLLAFALGVLAAPLAQAEAAIPLQNAVARPVDTTQAKAPTRFHMHVDLGGAEHIKDMTTQLPVGISPNLFQPACPVDTFMSDGCPDNTKVGTTSVNLTVLALPQQVSGRIYYLVPVSGDPFPGLGIVLEPPPPAPKAYQRGRTRISPETGGLETVIQNFPTDSGGIPIRINSIDIVLASTFISNPAVCNPATTNFLITSYEDPNTVSRASDTYTPTGCEALPPPPVHKCRVPRLRHRLLAPAKRAIRSAHCAVGRVTRKESADRNRGRVIAQSPAAGRTFAAGKRVNLAVGK
jgi:PASTA domain-containing protein